MPKPKPKRQDRNRLLASLPSADYPVYRVHFAEQRCARWLLLSHDRVPGDEIALTQELLAEMLGMWRASATKCAGGLRRKKLIDYRRARIQVRDRAGLEKAACKCYAFIRAEHDRLVG